MISGDLGKERTFWMLSHWIQVSQDEWRPCESLSDICDPRCWTSVTMIVAVLSFHSFCSAFQGMFFGNHHRSKHAGVPPAMTLSILKIDQVWWANRIQDIHILYHEPMGLFSNHRSSHRQWAWTRSQRIMIQGWKLLRAPSTPEHFEFLWKFKRFLPFTSCFLRQESFNWWLQGRQC